MDIKKGQIVISKAGHDDGQPFVVVEVKDNYVYLADGKERKLNALKKKNIKHIAVTNSVVNLPDTDKSLRKLLNSFSRVNQED